MERLILFDIDGTLTRTQNGYIPFNEAVQKTFGICGDIRTVVPDGNTDPLIVKDIFINANVAMEILDAEWPRFSANLHDCYKNAVDREATTVCALPGAMQLLQALSADKNCHSSVVTGNFEVTAAVKLKAAGLAPYLCRGAYASDSQHRIDLPQIAKSRWEEFHGRTLLPQQCIVIGDTPKDLEAARHNKMKCVLVGTGRYPLEELLYWRPDACLADLTDTASVLAILSRI
jgi:phosphoglycolate phosphatase-like HAD superfamily hydrolase